MAPFVVLVSVFVLLRTGGFIGWAYMDDWHHALKWAVAAMLLLTASAHWGKRRKDLIRMVPSSFPKPELIVTITGWLEIAGAVGIVIDRLSPVASVCLAVLFVAMFPANVRAAREKLTIAGAPVPNLFVRTVLQLLFIAAVLLAG